MAGSFPVNQSNSNGVPGRSGELSTILLAVDVQNRPLQEELAACFEEGVLKQYKAYDFAHLSFWLVRSSFPYTVRGT